MEKKTEKKELINEIIIPNEIIFEVKGNKVCMTKDGKNLEKKFDKEINLKKEENKIIISSKKSRRKEKGKFGTTIGHIKNMISGLMNGFEYELEMCNIHFPMTVSFDKAKSEFMIKNLLGEKHPRMIKVTGNIEVEIKPPVIKIKSHDIEAAGRAASRLERGSLIKYRDRNKFQDGIFITKKPGKEYV